MLPVKPPARLLMTTDAVGGIWRYAQDACRLLAARGVDATLVGMGPAPSEAQREEAAGIPLVWLDESLDWMAGGPEPLQRAGAALASVARELRVDVVHLNSPALLPFVDVAVPRVAAAHSCLATWWQAMKDGPPPPEWRWHRELTARGLKTADLVLAPSLAFATALEAAYGRLPRLRVVHNGAAPVPAMPKSPFVLSAGRWWDEAKNLRVLEAVAGRLPWPVQVAGPLQAPGERPVWPQTVEWVGDLPNRTLRGWMARAPIFTSLSLYEPFGLAVLEAASAETALVLANIPTFRELWGSCALFVDPADPVDVADAVNELIASERLRAHLGAAAGARSRDYTLERQTEGLLAAYADLPVRAVAV